MNTAISELVGSEVGDPDRDADYREGDDKVIAEKYRLDEFH